MFKIIVFFFYSFLLFLFQSLCQLWLEQIFTGIITWSTAIGERLLTFVIHGAFSFTVSGKGQSTGIWTHAFPKFIEEKEPKSTFEAFIDFVFRNDKLQS